MSTQIIIGVVIFAGAYVLASVVGISLSIIAAKKTPDRSVESE